MLIQFIFKSNRVESGYLMCLSDQTYAGVKDVAFS